MCHFFLLINVTNASFFNVQVNPRHQCSFVCLFVFMGFCKHGCPHSISNCSHRTGRRNCISGGVRKPRPLPSPQASMGWIYFYFYFYFPLSCVAHPQSVVMLTGEGDGHDPFLNTAGSVKKQKAHKCTTAHHACIHFATILYRAS